MNAKPEDLPEGDDFARLQLEAAGITPPPAGAPVGEPEKPASSMGTEIRMGLEMFRAAPFVESNLPRFHAELTDEAIAKAADALGAVADKYGLTTGGVLEKYGIEIKAAWVVGCWSWVLSKALMVDIAVIKARAAQPTQPPAGDGN